MFHWLFTSTLPRGMIQWLQHYHVALTHGIDSSFIEMHRYKKWWRGWWHSVILTFHVNIATWHQHYNVALTRDIDLLSVGIMFYYMNRWHDRRHQCHIDWGSYMSLTFHAPIATWHWPVMSTLLCGIDGCTAFSSLSVMLSYKKKTDVANVTTAT